MTRQVYVCDEGMDLRSRICEGSSGDDKWRNKDRPMTMYITVDITLAGG